MIKALIVGADAFCPEYVFTHPERYPNLAALMNRGAYASYSAYVQKGFHDSYLSEMNWSSIYTGLAPWEHKIAEKLENNIRKSTAMEQYECLQPFWKMLNEHNISVGLWSAMCCEDPVEIDGYAVSVKHTPLETPDQNRWVKRTLQVPQKDQWILEQLQREVPLRLYPKTLAQQGYTFRELQQDDALAWEAVKTYHFQESLENFRDELDFFLEAITTVHQKRPVDVIYFYTPSTDLIAHCCMYCDDNDVLIRAYQLLDQFVGKLVELLDPEYTVVMSDHGMCNFKELVHSKKRDIQRAAFAARNEVLWLDNGYIAFEAHNGALLFTAHSLKGMFILSGPDIRHCEIQGMRTLDIYPTLLEMFGISVPKNRSGFVQNIFNRPLLNEEKCYFPKPEVRVAVLQCFNPSITDILVNEIYVRQRFIHITVVGENCYQEIYEYNPRVSGFVAFDEFDPKEYEQIYCGVYTENGGIIGQIKLK